MICECFGKNKCVCRSRRSSDEHKEFFFAVFKDNFQLLHTFAKTAVYDV